MRLLLPYTLLCILLVISACKTKAPHLKNPFTGECPLEDMKWMKVSNNYDSETVITLVTELAAAAKADAADLKGLNADGSATANFNSNFERVLNSRTGQDVFVSQSFFQDMKDKRNALCNILVLLDDDRLTATQRDNLITSYTNINNYLTEVKEEEQKKNQ